MTETLSFTKNQNKFKDENESLETKSDKKRKERRKSIDSSNPESSFNNLNSEIKSIIENETDLSFSSNSNSDLEEKKENIEHLFDSKYWRVSKEISSETDEPNSTYEIQNEKGTSSKKENFIIVDKKKSPKPFHSKYADMEEMAGMNLGSNKKSTQSNEDDETRLGHLNNISYCEINNNSIINNFEGDGIVESEENEKINIKEEKFNNENIKDNNNNINNMNNINNINNNINNRKLFANGFNNYTNLPNLKYNNDSKYAYSYKQMNYKNNNIPFLTGVYFPPHLYPLMPNYNYTALNKKNFIPNNNINNKLEEANNSDKKEGFHSIDHNNINGQNNQFTHSNLNNMNNYNKKMDILDLPLVLNQKNSQNNPINYRYPPKINFNMLCHPQIQPMNTPLQKPVTDKTNNRANFLPEINKKENLSNINGNKTKNNENISTNNNNTNSTINNNICSIIEQNNNKMKTSNKNFAKNEAQNMRNNKQNPKGEKQILNLDDIVTGKDTRTTVMIRNIPIKYTDEKLIEALSEFNGKYDCLYMPFDYEKNGNKGYAFINFINPLHILYFYEKFNRKKWLYFESSKICELNCAHFQGINEIQKHAKNYKGQKKPNYYSRSENKENMIIPSKYLLKLKERFPKMVYTENKLKKVLFVKSFE